MKTSTSVTFRERGTAPIGFTRVELLAMLGALAMLAAVAWPVLANTKPRAQRVTCANNLAWIGRAERQWASENGDRMPWRSYSPPGGGVQLPVDQAWFWYSLMSNQLVTPKILACPSDPTARAATTFTMDPAGGFLNASYRNNAVSYLIGLDSFAEVPVSILAGDRNLQVSAYGSSCSSGVRNAAAINSRPIIDPRVVWTMNVHPDAGSLLLMDGRVEETSTARLRQVLALQVDDYGMLHFLMPRYP